MSSIRVRPFSRVFILCLLAAGTGAVTDTIAEETLPWSLRNRYTFPAAGAALDYGEADGRWRLRAGEDKVLAEDVSFSVVLADGAAVGPKALDAAETSREIFEHPHFGPGSRYVTRFPVHDGLRIAQEIQAFRQRPFVLLQLRVENGREGPMAIEELRPLVADSEAFAGFGPDTIAESRTFTTRGGCVVFNRTAAPIMRIFVEPALDMVLAIGILPAGNAETGLDFQSAGGVWQGQIRSRYTPALRLAPGETAASDWVWLAYGNHDDDAVDANYSWAFSSMDLPVQTPAPHAGWVTVAEDGSLSDLVSTASDWKGAGLRSAVIPAGWQSGPGTLEGAPPRYPRDIGEAARRLQDAEMEPGITVDPLATDKKAGEWVIESADGRRWIDPRPNEAREYAAGRLRTLLAEGFAFLVLEPSMVPGGVLAQLGLTRGEADWLAFAIAADAAEGAQVYPASQASLGPDAGHWIEAANDLGALQQYHVVPAPIRFDAPDGTDWPSPLVAAMKAWQGPIEFTGPVSRSARSSLAAIFAGP